jgi:transposase
MENKTRYETERLDHLGIVAGISHEIGLAKLIDEKVGMVQRKVSCGQAVQAMVMNALGFSSRALYMMPDYLHNKPVELLIGPGLSAEDFNDDTLGRSLDDLYESGVTELFAGIASQALRVYGIEHQFVHLDSSSFHLHGQYETEEAESETEAIQITYGYSRDHRPDLKQAIAQIITSQSSALPVWLEVLSGNTSDKDSFPKSVTAYCKHLGEAEKPYFVMDSAGYSADNLEEMKDIFWITRVPETLSEAQRLVRETAQGTMQEVKPGYFAKEFDVTYANIKQRWLVVYSEAAYQRELHGLENAQKREQTQVEKEWRKLCQQEYQCLSDAETALQKFSQGWKYHKLLAKAEPITKYAQPGRPSASDKPEIVAYHLLGTVAVADDAFQNAKKSLGKFIIATNQLDTAKLPPKTMLEHYTKQGVSVERGFRFLKDPLFFAHSLFLKKPERIMALIMIMALSLLIYALAERQLRQALAENKQTLPDQKGKPTQVPTIRWIFQLFEGIDLLSIWQNDQLLSSQLINLRPVHVQIVQLFGQHVKNCYPGIQ